MSPMKTTTETKGNVTETRYYYTRTFTAGSLVGMSWEDSLPFVSPAAFERWCKGVNRNNKLGTVDYKVVPV